MNQPETQRASRVCRTCKNRKKGCDKAIPNCGYCDKRRLVCYYNTSLADQNSDAIVHDSTTGHLPTPGNAPEYVELCRPNDFLAVSNPATTSLYDFIRIRNAMALNDCLDIEVRRITESVGMPIRDICEQFFHGFHHWLPIISPERFWKINFTFHNRPPEADFSVLLLAMCLITLRPKIELEQSGACFKSLYATVKFSFAKVQAVVCASTSLVQAGILVATYEYACKKSETAYISIGTCSRMSGILGINRPILQSDQGLSVPEFTLQDLEGRNVWWGVIIIERLSLVEIADRAHHPMSDFPKNDFPLPFELCYDPLDDSQSEQNLRPRGYTVTLDHFGRQAQAISILDQILNVVTAPHTEDAKCLALVILDEQLQAFSALIMGEYRTPGRHCTANATVIRSFFLLHQGMLNHPMETTIEALVRQDNSSSWVALDAAARMMAAVAGHHVKHVTNIDVLPSCAAYNAQIAIEHIAARREHVDSDWVAALESLQSFEGAFRQRWPAQEDLVNWATSD